MSNRQISVSFVTASSNQVEYEIEIQNAIEDNLARLFDFTLIKSELRLCGGALRVDSFALSAAMQPVFIEYKRGEGKTAVDQALAYRNAIKTDRASIELAIAQQLGMDALPKINWADPLAICVASSFSRHSLDAIGFINSKILLITYAQQGPGDIQLDMVASNFRRLSKPRRPPSSPKANSFTERKRKLSQNVATQLDELLEQIRALGQDLFETERGSDLVFGLYEDLFKICISDAVYPKISIEFFCSADEISIADMPRIKQGKSGFIIPIYNEDLLAQVTELARKSYEMALNSWA